MTRFDRFRPLLLTLGCAALTAFALGTAIVEGWHEPAARYLDAECRGFDALVVSAGRLTECVKPAVDTLGAKAAIVVDLTAPLGRRAALDAATGLPEA